MVSSIDKVTLLPAILLFALSVYLGFLNIQVTDSAAKVTLLNYATVSFIAGIILIATWVVVWMIRLGSEKT